MLEVSFCWRYCLKAVMFGADCHSKETGKLSMPDLPVSIRSALIGHWSHVELLE